MNYATYSGGGYGSDLMFGPPRTPSYTNNVSAFGSNNPTLAAGYNQTPPPVSQQPSRVSPLERWFQGGKRPTLGAPQVTPPLPPNMQPLPAGAIPMPPAYLRAGVLPPDLKQAGWTARPGPDGNYYLIPPQAPPPSTPVVPRATYR